MPITRVRRSAVSASRTAASAACQAASTSWACGNRASPTAVNRTVRRSRSNRTTPSRFSSIRICLLSAGWETNSRSAARVKLNSSATAVK